MPHYPIRQPDGLLGVWSTIVDCIVAFDCLPTEAADEISRWHRGDHLAICERVANGDKPFSHWNDWDDCVGEMLARYGETDDTVMQALERTPNRRISDLIHALWRAESRADDAECEVAQLKRLLALSTHNNSLSDQEPTP